MNDDERFMEERYERRQEQELDKILDEVLHRYELRHKWHVHTELPEKKVTEETLQHIAEIMDGKE